MAEENKAVEAVADAAAAKIEATGAVVAATEAKDQAAEAAAAVAATAEAAREAVAAAASAEAIAEDAATRDAAERIGNFERELGTCRTEISSLKALTAELQASSASALATLTQLDWLREAAVSGTESIKPEQPKSEVQSGETKVDESSSGAKTELPSGPEETAAGAKAAETGSTPKAGEKPRRGARKHNWL